MFHRTKELQFDAKPDKPDPIFAKQCQEILGGQWGEMSVMMGYLFQGWNCRAPAKYRDMILDIGTEEIAHVEILATLIARLLETSPVEDQEDAAKNHPALSAVLGGARVEDTVLSGMNPQHMVLGGMGALPSDSAGNHWSSRYIISSGNLEADFRFNVTAESQGRLEVCRLYELTDDPGIRKTLSFLIARDTMHQNQWLAALEELEKDGIGGTPVPVSFPQEKEFQEVSYKFMSFSEGSESEKGRWANGPSKDGRSTFEYVAKPKAYGPPPQLGAIDPRIHSTPRIPRPPKTAD